MSLRVFASICILLSTTSFAMAQQNIPEGYPISKLQGLLPEGANIVSLVESELAGVYLATTDTAEFFYVDANAEYAFLGDLYQLSPKKGVRNLTEFYRRVDRKRKIQEVVNDDEYITLKAEDEKLRLYIFFDVDCPYCKRMYRYKDAYAKLGYSLSFLPFPRSGSNKLAVEKLQYVWCKQPTLELFEQAIIRDSFDFGKSMDQLNEKEREQLLKVFADDGTGGFQITDTEIAGLYSTYLRGRQVYATLEGICTDTVFKYAKLGEYLGVEGTPAIYSSEGDKIAGFVYPVELDRYLTLMAESRE